jgi:hypothetical protein
MATSQIIGTPRETRRTLASYGDYAAAERAVDWLDEGVADEAHRLLGAMPGGR